MSDNNKIGAALVVGGYGVRVSGEGRISLDYTHNNLEGHERLVRTLCDSLDGFVDHAHPISQHHLQLDSLLPLYGTAHQSGIKCTPLTAAACWGASNSTL